MGSKIRLPSDWLVCNGFVLPTNYVDIKRFENIYRTHNCFRVFLSNSKAHDDEIKKRMAGTRGVVLEDFQARKLCEEVCNNLFGKRTTRHLNVEERITLANTIRSQYHISFRQLSFLVKIPEMEIRKYIK